jgi:hypothetical protein
MLLQMVAATADADAVFTNVLREIPCMIAPFI